MTRIGPYQVLGVVGEGGMGRVYRARDERLGRLVAIKVLPDELRDDPGRLRRFQREARAIGKLSHPNVLTVHDVGEHEGAPYLVTELLRGETLRERLKRGPLAPADAIDVALQVARGLAVAHDSGIVHRDLKPSNLFVCDDGYVKILDFGIAKQRESGDVARTETAVTREGAPIGSVGYMAPEQIRGKQVGAHTDVFALGIVLFEMIAGARPFDGDTDVEVAVATLQRRPPELSDRAIDAVVGRCLEKAPADRYASARELASELEALAASEPVAIAPRVTPARALRRRPRAARTYLAAAAALAVAGGGTGVWMMRGGDAAESGAPPAAAGSLIERRVTRLPDPIWRHAVSQDGETIAYQQKMRTFVRPTSGGQPRELRPPEGWEAVTPFDFFPDGNRMMVLLAHDGFAGERALAVYDLRDDSVRIVHREPDIGLGGRLAPDGSVFAFTGPDGIRTISVEGGDVRLVVPGSGNMSAMSWSPDAAHLAYIQSDAGEVRLMVAAADGGVIQRLPTGPLAQNLGEVFGVEWFDDGRIVFSQAGSEASELWEIGVRNGQWDGEPARRSYRFAQGTVDHFRRGGDRLFVLKNVVNQDIYTADLEAAGNLAAEPRPIVHTDARDIATDITASGELLLFSKRDGSLDVFRRSRDGAEQAVVATDEAEVVPVAAGDAVLYWVDSDGWVLHRIEAGQREGRPLREFPPGALPSVDCARERPDRCVVSEQVGKDLVVHWLDPTTGQVGEVIHRRPLADVQSSIRLDADGSRGVFALGRTDSTLAIIGLEDRSVRELPLDASGVAWLKVDWLPGGGFVFTALTPGVPFWLGIADAEGHTRELWRTENFIELPPVPFPDGKRIAFTVNDLDIDQWAIDGL